MNKLNKVHNEEEYDNLLYTVISTIQDKIEESIRNGEWDEEMAYDIVELKGYDEDTIESITEGINQYQGGELEFDGFVVKWDFDGYVMYYQIEVDTYVCQCYINYDLMDKLLSNNYLKYIVCIEKYIKAFGDDKKLRVDHDGREIIVKDPEQHAKVTFYIDDWGRWEHTMERID